MCEPCSVNTKADNKNSVVEPAGAAEEGEGVAHPAHIELHGKRIEGNADGAVLEEPLGHLLLVLGDLDPPAHPDRHLGPVELARFVLPVVAIFFLSLQPSNVHQGLVGILHEAASTSAIQLVAIDQLLLRQADQLPIGDCLLPLHVAGHTESPARAAHSLVLDIRDRPMFSPVKRLGQLHVWDLGWRPVDFWWIVPP